MSSSAPEDSAASASDDSSYSRWKRDATIAATAGGLAAAVMALGMFAVGNVSASEARVMVEAILPTSRFLCSSVMTATATILALMLTLLGMTIQTEQKLKAAFYHRIKQIALYNMLILVASVAFLVVHCIPITKSDEIPSWWYSTVYYALLSISAAMGGAVVAVVVMLYMAIRDIINVFGLKQGEHLLQDTTSG